MIRDELGECAYAGYCAEHERQSGRNSLSPWEHLPEDFQRAWVAASRAVASRTAMVREIEVISSPSGMCSCQHHLMFHDIGEAGDNSSLMCCIDGCGCGRGGDGGVPMVQEIAQG